MVQIIILGDVARPYLSHIESTLARSRVPKDTLFLSPKMDLGAVVAQMKNEGVKAILFLNSSLERSGRVAMQHFRTGGQVSEYESIQPEAAVDILIRNGDLSTPSSAPSTGYGAPLPSQPLLQGAGQPALASVIANLASAAQAQGQALDPNTLAALTSLASGGGAAPQVTSGYRSAAVPGTYSSLQQQPGVSLGQGGGQPQLAALLSSLSSTASGSGGLPANTPSVPTLMGVRPQQQPFGLPNLMGGGNGMPGAGGPTSGSVSDILNRLKSLTDLQKR